MTSFSDLTIPRRIEILEEALARVLPRADWDVEVEGPDKTRRLVPVVRVHGNADLIERPVIDLYWLARDLERMLP